MSNEDIKQLNLLATFHYVVGGLLALFACMPFIHVTLGILMITGKLSEDEMQEPAVGWLFVIMGAVFILLGWVFAALILVAGKKLRQQKNRTFCFAVAAVECIFTPFGTVLGVFTIIALSRDSVRWLFAQPGTMAEEFEPAPAPVQAPPAIPVIRPENIMLPKTSGLAVSSMVIGIIGFLGGWMMCFGNILPILAIVFGHVANCQIRKQPDLLSGRGMAKTGLILGYACLVIYFIFAILLMIGSVMTEDLGVAEESLPCRELSITSDVFTNMGYEVISSVVVAPSEWEQREFNLLSKREIKIKSLAPVIGEADLFYRFTVVVEEFPEICDAMVRQAGLLENPPGISPSEEKAYPLRKSFRDEEVLYTVTTDVSFFFDTQIDIVLKALKEELLGSYVEFGGKL